jgi:hypothetical protein
MQVDRLGDARADGWRALVRRAFVLALLVAVLVAVPRSARAGECSNVGDKSDCPEAWAYESARGIGAGAGLRSTAVSTSALAYSPAGLALGSLYHVEGNIDYIGSAKTVALGGAVVDSSTSKLGAGIGLRGFLSGDEGYDGLDGRLGLGLALSEAFAVGLAARYISLSRDLIDADGESSEIEMAQGFTLDGSLRIIPTPGFQIDVAALNFVDLEEAEVPVTLAGGLGLALGSAFSLGADLLADMSTFDDPEFIAGAALEYLGGNTVPLRAGYRGDLGRERHAITAGLGYTDQQIGLDVGLRQEVKGGDETRVTVSMRYYVH